MVRSLSIPFALSLILALPQIVLSTPQENIETATSILHRICNAVHLPETQRPGISLYESGISQSWAYYHPTTKMIRLNRVLFEVLREKPRDFADNTLAMIIGHELAHHIQRTSCEDDGYLIPQSNQLHTRNQEELDADFQGVFAAFLAGYRVDLYLQDSFEFLIEEEPDHSTSYPTIQERILSARSFFLQVDTALIFYQLGLSLIELQQWEKAGQCLERVYELYQGREVTNSLAVVYMYEGLAYLPASYQLIAYPFETDPEIRLHFAIRQPPNSSPDQSAYWFSKARYFLEKAKREDPDYQATYINLLCLEFLEGRFNRFSGVFSEHFSHRQQEIENYLKILTKLLNLETQQREAYLRKQLTDHSHPDEIKSLLKMTLEVMNPEPSFEEREAARTWSLDNFYSPSNHQGDRQKIFISPNNQIFKYQLAYSEVYFWDDSPFWIQVPSLHEFSFRAPHKILTYQHPFNEVNATAVLGPCHIIHPTAFGKVFVYQHAGLIVWTDLNDAVFHWCLFGNSE